jgi:hypothetical protein
MANLNEVVCATNIMNTGVGTCFLDLSFTRGAIRVPEGKVFTQTELTALRATLDAARLAPLKSNRIFPLHNFKTITDNSEDTIYQTLGDGTQIPVRDGNYRWTYQYIDGGMCLALALRSHNFQKSSWLFYDNNDVLFGWRKDDGTGAYGLSGIPVTFHANKPKFATAAEVAAYTVYFEMDPKYIADYLGFVKAGFSLSEITGLQNIVLRQTGASAAGVVKIQALTGCDYANMYDLYSTELASSPSLWIITNTLTGNVITTTSVAVDANAKAFTLTAASADPDYPATSGGFMNITLANPTLLDAADISGFEANTVTVLRG